MLNKMMNKVRYSNIGLAAQRAKWEVEDKVNLATKNKIKGVEFTDSTSYKVKENVNKTVDKVVNNEVVQIVKEAVKFKKISSMSGQECQNLGKGILDGVRIGVTSGMKVNTVILGVAYLTGGPTAVKIYTTELVKRTIKPIAAMTAVGAMTYRVGSMKIEKENKEKEMNKEDK